MRHLVLTAACALAAGHAFASSIEKVTVTNKDGSSVAVISCAACPPLKPVKKKSVYIVPEVEQGTERVELKKLNGEMKLVRTEAWLGGSPVVFITKASEDVIKAAEAKSLSQPAAADIAEAKAADPAAIDTTATTSSLVIGDAKQPMTAHLAGSREFDPGDLELRLK